MAATPSQPGALIAASRYETLLHIATGGMASVYVGRLRGAAGFSRLVAIKRALPHIALDPHARKMVIQEARLASKLHHPNVVAVVDVEELEGELLLVMGYVEGAPLSDLIRASNAAGGPLPPAIAIKIALDACAGLHAAHELADELGTPLHLVHRDVSPQNVLIGVDGIARLTDFGVAKSVTSSLSATAAGSLKGKLAYMAPEYVEKTVVNPRIDVFAMGVVLWEALANRRLFRTDTDVETLQRVLHEPAPALRSLAPALPSELDDVIAVALEKSPSRRFESAEAFARALESVARRADLIAPSSDVAACVRSLLAEPLARRREALRAFFQPDPSDPGESDEDRDSITHLAPPPVASRPDPEPDTQTTHPAPARSASAPSIAHEAPAAHDTHPTWPRPTPDLAPAPGALVTGVGTPPPIPADELSTLAGGGVSARQLALATAASTPRATDPSRAGKLAGAVIGLALLVALGLFALSGRTRARPEQAAAGAPDEPSIEATAAALSSAPMPSSAPSPLATPDGSAPQPSAVPTSVVASPSAPTASSPPRPRTPATQPAGRATFAPNPYGPPRTQ